MNKLLSFNCLLFIFAATAFAQQTAMTAPRVVSAADYARAEKMLGFNTGQLVDRSGLRPTFMPDGKFYYRVLTATGSEYVLINPADGSRKTAADLNGLGITNTTEKPTRTRRNPGGDEVVSPDGRRAAYIKKDNLWMRDLESGKETPLTTDGVKDFGYATDNAGWVHSDRAILV
ncbi:MAG: DPP IV N-terminal domain-containing protein, partial [Acidobacteriota bacterium]|nr:DPP IV N-terminal domain-containing protein [Acidobacteriota bacterium]